jgi:hypothetical protein
MSRSKKDGKHSGAHHKSKCVMCRNNKWDTKGRPPKHARPTKTERNNES